jgi:UDP-N-acetylmuramate--alanine ligase
MVERCHFIGIGGIGMSGLARILLKKNVQVSGSDLSLSYITEGLIKEGAKVFVGHSSANITPEMTVVYSSDIKKDNPEYLQALNLKCTLLHRSDLLMQLMNNYKTLAIAGTHGKTTTTALLTWVLMEGQFDPSFAIGGVLPHLKTNAGHGKGEYFIAEADESDGTFLKYHPWGAIVTNIDTDHMDYYKTESNLTAAFNDFLRKIASPSHLFWCGDDQRLKALNPPGVAYGFQKHCRLHISHFHQEGWKIFFDITFQEKTYSKIELPLLGRHNALNAAAIFGLALSIGLSEDAIRQAFKSFKGIMRRCEIKVEFQGVTVIDDYAHHPTEISATLRGISEAVKEKRVLAIFQPHRFSRTKECLGTYGKIFDDADELFVTDIFGAGETPIAGLSSSQIVAELQANSKIPCRYVAREDLAKVISGYLRPHDVVVTLGAGDITKLAVELLNYNKKEPVSKLKIGVIYGGKSLEHEVSLMSAEHIINSLSPDYYEIVQFGITKQGQWFEGADVYENLQASTNAAAENSLSFSVLEQLNRCDVLFPVLHGPNGEDGTIQGFFEMLGKAYVGCDYRSSALCMDKALTKKLMVLNGVPTPSFIDFSHHDWKTHPDQLVYQTHQQLQYPLFVKPVHLGSSVGVYKVENEDGLRKAIDQAFLVDHHVLIENGLKVREIEFAALGNDNVAVFPPGEVFTEGNLYDYEAKYSAKAMPATPKANLTDEQIKEGIYLAETAFVAAGCCGMARVDCFLDEAGKMWLNEINPIPGFTKNSLYPKMCEVNGIPAKELVDRLIILGMQRKRQRDRCN